MNQAKERWLREHGYIKITENTGIFNEPNQYYEITICQDKYKYSHRIPFVNVIIFSLTQLDDIDRGIWEEARQIFIELRQKEEQR